MKLSPSVGADVRGLGECGGHVWAPAYHNEGPPDETGVTA